MHQGRGYNFTLYSIALKPLQTNSNNVFKFSGLGAVTKTFEYLPG